MAVPEAFAVPVGPVFSDFAGLAHFVLETAGAAVIHTLQRSIQRHRGVKRIAKGQNGGRVLHLAERLSGAAAFAHGLAFCQAIKAIRGTKVPARHQEKGASAAWRAFNMPAAKPSGSHHPRGLP